MFRVFFIFGVMALFAGSAAWGEYITISRNWTKVHEKPSSRSKPIDLLFGNATLKVLEKKNGWYLVETPKDREGWVYGGNVLSGRKQRSLKYPETRALNNALAMQRMGYQQLGREKMIGIILTYPNTLEYYESVRHLLYFHQGVGRLSKPIDDEVTSDQMDQAKTLIARLFFKEGEDRLREKLYLEAVSLFSMARLQGAGRTKVLKGIRKALMAFMNQAMAAKHTEDLGLAVTAYKNHFPAMPLPPRIHRRINGLEEPHQRF